MSGIGTVLGELVGFAGRVTAVDLVEGHVTYVDGTRAFVRVSAETEDQLRVTGLGGSHRLVRR